MPSLLIFLCSAGLVLRADPAAPGKLVQLGDRKVHVRCTGSGDSTVLLVSGIPRFSFHFALVQSDLAASARVCTYDKGGEA